MHENLYMSYHIYHYDISIFYSWIRWYPQSKANSALNPLYLLKHSIIQIIGVQCIQRKVQHPKHCKSNCSRKLPIATMELVNHRLGYCTMGLHQQDLCRSCGSRSQELQNTHSLNHLSLLSHLPLRTTNSPKSTTHQCRWLTTLQRLPVFFEPFFFLLPGKGTWRWRLLLHFLLARFPLRPAPRHSQRRWGRRMGGGGRRWWSLDWRRILRVVLVQIHQRRRCASAVGWRKVIRLRKLRKQCCLLYVMVRHHEENSMFHFFCFFFLFW